MSEFNISLPLMISFFIYLIVLLLIGIYFYSQNKNVSDYFIGGRKMGPLVTALSAGASDMSSWLLLGLPGLMYSQGIVSIWICIGLVLGSFLNWRIIAYRLRVLTEHLNDSITLPEFFANRYENKSDPKSQVFLRIGSSLVILIFFTLYVSAGFVGGAKLFEGTFDIDYHVSLLVGGMVIIFYTFFGGYFAVSWTDVFQGLLICISLVIFPMILLYEIGGWGEAYNVVLSEYPGHLEFFSVSLISIISYLSWGLGYFGQPHIVTRFISISSEKKINRSMIYGLTWMVIILIGSLLSSFLGVAYLHIHEGELGIKLKDAEHIIIFLNRVVLNPWVGGIIISAILSAIMSTVDSQLLVSASSISNDIYMHFFADHHREYEGRALTISRFAVLIIAVIAMLLAMDKNNRVLDLVSNAWAGFGSTFGPALLFSLYWKGTTARGILGGMLVGTLVVLLWPYLKGMEHPLFKVYEILPGFILASITIYIVSLLDMTRISNKITSELDM